MRKSSGCRKYIGPASLLILLFIFISPITVFAEDIEVRIQGLDDGVKSTKQQDYEEAVLFAKRQAIERAGAKISSKTTIENLILQKDYIEAQSGAVLLPGYQIVDIGYLENGTYSIILIGKVKTLDTKAEEDIDGVAGAKWGMSRAQIQEAFNALFTDPLVTTNISPPGTETYISAVKSNSSSGFFSCPNSDHFSFYFMDDKLYRVSISEHHPPWLSKERGNAACGSLILNHFSRERDSLYKKYGSLVVIIQN